MKGQYFKEKITSLGKLDKIRENEALGQTQASQQSFTSSLVCIHYCYVPFF